MPMQRLLASAGRWIDRIKINELARVTRDGNVFWVKRRRPGAGAVIRLGNAFFRLTGNRVVILGEASAWHSWERESSALLHGTSSGCSVDETGRLWQREFPGRSLSSYIDEGRAQSRIFAAAARELRRAHALDSPSLGGKWSHGDPHSGNFIYDSDADAAKLMDFEVRHDNTLSAAERHADDLLVFLQDTLGRLTRDCWIALSQTFVREYDRPEITRQLLDRLIEPRGLARLWWAVRTTYLAPREISSRLAALRSTLAAGGIPAGTP
jgi:hypothetical protein